MSAHDNEDLIDYEDEHEVIPGEISASATNDAVDGDDKVKKTFSGIHSRGFRDFLLKPDRDLAYAISDLGFEHPSEIASSLTGAILTPRMSDPERLKGGVVPLNWEAHGNKASERRDLGERRSASHDNQQ